MLLGILIRTWSRGEFIVLTIETENLAILAKGKYIKIRGDWAKALK